MPRNSQQSFKPANEGLKLTWVLIVADSEVRWHVFTNISEGAAFLGVASYMGGRVPHKLREVAPSLKVRHVRLLHAVHVAESIDLPVVEHICDDRPNVFTLDTGGDVLAVPTTVLFRVVRIGAAVCDLLGSCCEAIVPLKITSVGVVLAVQVVVTDNFKLVSSARWLRA